MFHIKTYVVTFLIITFFCTSPFSLSFAENNKDEWIAKDKVLHLIVSFILNTFTYNFYIKNSDYSDEQAKTAAALTTLAIGTAKEFIDKKSGKKFSWKDMVADALGTGIGAAVSIEF